MFYVIRYENGAERYGTFYRYADAVNYAESRSGGWNYTIEEYDSEDDYLNNI